MKYLCIVTKAVNLFSYAVNKTVYYGKVLGPSKKKIFFFQFSEIVFQFFEILSQFFAKKIFLVGPNTLP